MILTTNRLHMSPTDPADARRFAEILSDAEVGRNIAAIDLPYPEEDARAWIETHAAERAAGRALRFAVRLGRATGRMIGCCDVAELDTRIGALGFWYERAAWGHGYAFEAAEAVLAHAEAVADPDRFRAAHAHDNARSERLLARLGFVADRSYEVHSRARRGPVMQVGLTRPNHRRKA